MLSFFKSNNPAVVIFYIIYLVLFRLIFFFTAPEADFVFQYHEPLSNCLFGFLKINSLNFGIVSLSLGGVLCFMQALFINNIVNENKMLPKKNYMAGAVFIIFASFFKESLLLSPSSIALIFLILCSARIFALLRKEKSYGDIFDIGFLAALASLFYFPCIIFVLFAYIGLATVRPFKLREWLGVFTGFLAPFLLVFTYYFWNDRTTEMFLSMANIHAEGWLMGIGLTAIDKILIVTLAACTAASLVLLPSALYSSLIQVRKFSNTLILFIVLAAAAMLLQQSIRLSHFVLFSLPLAIFAAMILMHIKRNWIPEVIHIILILFVLSMQFLPLFNII